MIVIEERNVVEVRCVGYPDRIYIQGRPLAKTSTMHVHHRGIPDAGVL